LVEGLDQRRLANHERDPRAVAALTGAMAWWWTIRTGNIHLKALTPEGVLK
jgi:hypothetical protein